MEYIGLAITALAVIVLLILQYAMIITDIKKNQAKPWEIVIGMIPLGPYVLMILTGIWYFFTYLYRRIKRE